MKSPIELAHRTTVQPRWDGRSHTRDQRSDDAASGLSAWSNGSGGRLSNLAVYGIAAGLVVASSVVNAFSGARDISWRLGTPHNFWEPALWNATSGMVVLLLLPLVRRGVMTFRTRRPFAAAAAFIALAFAFSGLHIAGMGLLRELAYGIAGWSYTFPWSSQIPYEMRKDLFNYLALALIFWFAERPAHAAPAAAREAATQEIAGTPLKPEIWLRDGRTSVLIDAGEIVSVASAGNYVEYELTERRKHLIRATLQAEEIRLSSFGIARVHRSRLINLKKVVALQWRASGDFELRLDSGEVVVGSRRFKAAVAGLAD